MSAFVVAIVFIISVLFVLNYSYKDDTVNEPFYRMFNNTKKSNKCQSVESYDTNSPKKCNCGSCIKYGSDFDYKAQKGDRTHGVGNGCQKIF